MGDSAESQALKRSADERDQTAPPPADAETDVSEASDDELGLTIPEELPVLPVRGVVVFPGTVMPLTIGREKSKLLIDAVLAGDKQLAIFTQHHEDVDDPGIDDIYRIGTAAVVLKLLRMPDGTNSLLVHGLVRVGMEEMSSTDPYWKARVHKHEDEPVPESMEIQAMAFSARSAAEEVIALSPNIPDEAGEILRSIDTPGALADYLSANLSLGVVQKQELLETFDVPDRLRKVMATLNNQLEVLKLSQKIQADVRSEIDKTQREYYLQEQLKAIQKELGQTDSRSEELEQLRAQIAEAKMPEAVEREALREVERLERMSPAAPDYSMTRDYLDWLLEMPWSVETEDNLELQRAEEILDEDHYGLKRIKRRILEYLAVRKLKPDGKGPILCFVGPPGVGKTSLGLSIARALDRKFIRIALGGVRDEADIRGHRRTYIGAVPGRLVQEIRKAGSCNPVIMLDEVDKLGSDFRGDPASALLEVLDPNQNSSFTDHYLGVPFDLSKVLFIATANYMDPVAPALRDRMELIELAGYTTAEKVEIAKRYLVPKQFEDNGLPKDAARLDDQVLQQVIEGYTREAGVRTLNRTIGSICRGLAARVARDESIPKAVEIDLLTDLLGPIRFENEQALIAGMPGVATGLAYTPVGGQIIFVEATAMSGRGSFMLTGQIGDVMRESAQAAMSLVRARAATWKLDIGRLPQTDIHIHVPAGGIPKDGPSAGVAMVTAIASLIAQQPVDPGVGMTGEITLRGLVLPIGGVKEKVLAAHRAGLRRVILPKRNEPDLHDVPDDVRAEVQFHFAERVEDVIEIAVPGLMPAGHGRVAGGESGRKKTGSSKRKSTRQPKRSTARTTKRSATVRAKKKTAGAKTSKSARKKKGAPRKKRARR